MKKTAILVLLTLAGLNFITITAIIKKDFTMKPQDSTSTRDTNMFAVLELFTSEGCSSCPPAEELMEKLQKEYKGQPVYLLEYHVDYWDHQGWKDSFSNHDYTIRQSGYADLFRLNSIYTPQLVINGSSEMVGSDATRIRKAITKALATENNSSIIISPKFKGGVMEIDCKVTNALHSNLVIATIKKSATIHVKRGENEGRILSHIQIVQGLQYVSINKEENASARIQLPKEYNKAEWEIIVFVQHADNGNILAVTKVAGYN